MKKECSKCPFKRANEWRNGGIFWKMVAMEVIENAGNIFACHIKNPENNVFTGSMTNNDCEGFKKMLQNMQCKNKHSEIVNNILETNPTKYDFIGWAKQEGKSFHLINSIKFNDKNQTI